MGALKVYYDGSSHVIADNPKDATVFLVDHMGESYDDPEWEEVAPTGRITIAVDGDGKICSVDDDHDDLTLTAAEWIARQGAGFLCSEDC